MLSVAAHRLPLPQDAEDPRMRVALALQKVCVEASFAVFACHDQAIGNNPWNEKTGPKIECKADFIGVLEGYNAAMIRIAVVRPRFIMIRIAVVRPRFPRLFSLCYFPTGSGLPSSP
jgi:hypothetical protein